jgi:sugar lactone lactonase YvrE
MNEQRLAPAKISLRLLGLLLAFGLGAALLQAQQPPVLRRARILPSIVRLDPGQQQEFKILQVHRLTPTVVMKNVQWAVNDIPGGNAELGTIDSQGVYRAPQEVPVPNEIHICATANGAANGYLWATVLVGGKNPTYKVIRDWGEPHLRGLGRRSARRRKALLIAPHGITLDAQGNVLVVDEGSSRVVRYSPQGKYLGQIGLGPGGSEMHRVPGGYFAHPRCAAVDAQGNIFVADMRPEAHIQVFTPEGKFLYSFAVKGTEPGMLLRPHGIQFDSQQRLYVDDVDNFRINVYDHSGKFLFEWGKGGTLPGELNPPHGIFLDRNDDVFVCSYYGAAQKFTAHGHFLKAFAYPDPPNGVITYHTLNGDRWGDIYLSLRTLKDDPKDYISILKYNNNGDFVTALQLSTPDRHSKWVTVAQDGTVYSAYQGKSEVGVEVLREQ